MVVHQLLNLVLGVHTHEYSCINDESGRNIGSDIDINFEAVRSTGRGRVNVHRVRVDVGLLVPDTFQFT